MNIYIINLGQSGFCWKYCCVRFSSVPIATSKRVPEAFLALFLKARGWATGQIDH